MGEQHLPVTKGYYVPKMIHQAVLLKVAERDKRKEKKKDDAAQAEKRIKELFPSMRRKKQKRSSIVVGVSVSVRRRHCSPTVPPLAYRETLSQPRM